MSWDLRAKALSMRLRRHDKANVLKMEVKCKQGQEKRKWTGRKRSSRKRVDELAFRLLEEPGEQREDEMGRLNVL